ncbi:SDR family oxidoreductase [Agromyces tropicus]|uniref:SDR family oxidoreductase n=2 Tax=Agromyces tropicus TaxID=555371 RepID=A0ABP5GAK2_9MICO
MIAVRMAGTEPSGIVAGMDLQLQGRVVLVVGGAGYIGSAIVSRLREEGAEVIAASRRDTADLVIDGGDDASVAAGFARLMEDHGRLDALVVTAAPSARTLDQSMNSDPAQVLEGVDRKAMTFLRLANAALGPMREAGFGRIVGISGQNALLTGNVTGSVRNAALTIAAKGLADAAAGTGVTVNVVSPGLVTDTPSSEVQLAHGGESSPEQIADLVAFLVSPRAAAISGEVINIGHRVLGVTHL